MTSLSIISGLQIVTLPPQLRALAAMQQLNAPRMEILPKFDSETKETIYADYCVHHKFSMPEKFADVICPDEFMTYNMIAKYLKEIGTPAERLEGKKVLHKTGLFGFENKFGTAVRFWTSYKQENVIVFEVTVVGYPINESD